MSKNGVEILYRERVLPGLSFYVATIFVPVAIYLILLAFSADAAIISLIATEIIMVLISALAAPAIELSRISLRVGKANLPLAVLGETFTIAEQDAFNERGKHLNPAAFVRFQIGVRGLIKIQVNDKADPTPYLLFSSRRPQQLAELLKKLTS
jgi:hypothetical protein